MIWHAMMRSQKVACLLLRPACLVGKHNMMRSCADHHTAGQARLMDCDSQTFE